MEKKLDDPAAILGIVYVLDQLSFQDSHKKDNSTTNDAIFSKLYF
jgi:hypothetical protein